MAAFDPTDFNFVLLREFSFPGDVSAYELKNHPAVDGRQDFLRLNLYLSADRNYITIWFGLLEPIFTEAALESAAKPADFDFTDYNECLFRGYIDSDEAAKWIFKALRVGDGGRYAKPQILSKRADNNLQCDLIPDLGI